MNGVSHAQTQPSPWKSWFYNRERTPGVIGSSPADHLRDSVALGAGTAAVAAVSTSAVAALGTGVLASIALAVPVAVVGLIGGGLIAGIGQEAMGAILHTGPSNDEGGALAGGGVLGALVGAGGAIAAGLGAAPLTVAVAAVGAVAGLMTIAAMGMKSSGG